MGWYHSHPGYGCWLSGIDVNTQLTNQQFQDPFVAVVVRFSFYADIYSCSHASRHRLTQTAPSPPAKLTLVPSAHTHLHIHHPPLQHLSTNQSHSTRSKISGCMRVSIISSTSKCSRVNWIRSCLGCCGINTGLIR